MDVSILVESSERRGEPLRGMIKSVDPLKPTFMGARKKNSRLLSPKTTGYDSKINEILFLDQALIQKPELSFCTDRHEEKTELFLWSGTVHTKLSAKIITDHRFAWNPVQPVQQPPHWPINKKLTTTTPRRPWRRLFL